jgi:hypothetical protein
MKADVEVSDVMSWNLKQAFALRPLLQVLSLL